MCHASWCALTVLAALAAVSPTDTDSSEELRQALVLVDILRSGIARHKTASISPAPLTTLPTTQAPWLLPPYGPPYYAYGAPFRRYYGVPDGRRARNAGRQLQYDDSFGAHPGDDEQDGNKDLATAQATSKIPDQQPITSSTAATQISNVDVTTAATTTKETITTDTQATKITEAVPFATTVQKTHKSTDIAISTSNTQKVLNQTSVPTNPTAKTKKLNYLQANKLQKKFSEESKKSTQSGDQIEMSQVAEELKREATDTMNGGHSSGNFLWRYRGTTRVHLARSSPLPRPLPANNAFCYINPESPLCHTFI